MENKTLKGMGRVYRPRYTRKRSDGSSEIYECPVWWIAFWHRGTEYRESSKSTEERVAVKLLRARTKELGRDRVVTIEQRITFAQLMDDLKSDYQINEKRSIRSLNLSISHLKTFFEGDRAVEITTDRVRKYIEKRQKESAAAGSINLELSALKRAFSLSIEAERLFHRPHIPMLELNNVREGFLGHAEFLRLRDELPDYLKAPIAFLYLSGWRSGEMKTLEWGDVAGDVIRLRAENSKNKKPRVLPLRGGLAEIIEGARAARRPDCPYVFFTLNGAPIGKFAKSWRKACVAAGLGYFETVGEGRDAKKVYQGLRPHDLRRSAVKNFIAAGIPEKVCMSLSGHRTRSVFDRYHIVSEDDLVAASDRLFVHLEKQTEAAKIVPLRRAS